MRTLVTIEERADTPPESERVWQRQGPKLDGVVAEELAFCKRRGHHAPGLHVGERWKQCDLCGTWLRAVESTEEREQEPPEDEMDPRAVSARILDDVQTRLKELEGGAGKRFR